MPRNPMETVIGVADRMRMSLEAMLGSLPSTDTVTLEYQRQIGKPVAPAIAVARSALEPFLAAISRLRQALPDLGAAVVAVATNNTLTPDARRAGAADVVAAARPAIEADLATLYLAATSLTYELRQLALPQRPAGDPIAQDLALDRRERAMRMVCDALPVAMVPDRLLDFLRDAIAKEDELAVWQLAGSDWPSLYIESRSGGSDEDLAIAGSFGVRASDVLGELLASDDAKIARQILEVVEAGPGVAGAAIACREWVLMYLDDIARDAPIAAPSIAALRVAGRSAADGYGR